MNLIKLDNLVFTSTKQAWENELEHCEEHFSTLGYLAALDSLEKRLETSAPNMHYFALVDAEEQVAKAIVVASNALPNSPDGWVKALEIRMTPEIDSRNPRNIQESEFLRYEQVTQYAAEIVSGLLDFTKECGSSKLKIFANIQTDLTVLKAVAHNLRSSNIVKNLGISVDSYKNWIEFSV